MSADCPARTRLLREIDDMQTMSSRIAAAVHILPSPHRDEVFAEMLAALTAAADGVVAVSVDGNDRGVAVVLDLAVLRLTESAAAAAQMIRSGILDAPGAAR